MNGRYTVQKLGPLQQQILKHFFMCQRKVESINHISGSLGAKGPSVSRSVSSLIKEKYLAVDREKESLLKREAGSKFFEKSLYVTDKGMLYSNVVLDIKYDQLIDYTQKYGMPYAADIKRNLNEHYPNKEKRELFAKKTYQFYLENNWFDEAGDMCIHLTAEEQSKLRLRLMQTGIGYIESIISNNSGPRSLTDLLETASINKIDFKEYLANRKKGIEHAIKELGQSSEG